MDQSRQYPSQTSSTHHVPQSSPAPSQSSPTTTTNTTANKKRRTSTTGSRGVANLTPEQLAKKRANDREAQRAIRERTKGQIEQLENRIQQLTEQKPYQELQDVVRQKEMVEAENEDIKRRLASVLSIIQPMCGRSALDPSQECAGLGIQNQVYSPEAVQPRQDPPGSSIFHEPNSARSVGSASSTYAPSPQAPRHAMPPSPYTSQPPGFSPFGRRHGSGGQHSLLSRSPADEKLEFGHLLQQQQQQQGRHNSRGGRDLQAYGVEETPSVHSISNQPMSTLSPFENDREDCPPAYAYPPKNINQTCPLDGLLLKFLADQRQRALEGVPTGELIGPPYPSFRSLINPQASDSSHALSRVFTDMLGKFPDISTLPEQVGILYIMFIVMRWQIWPTQETYDRLPDWMTPRPSQLFVPHPIWVDHLPWPRMRDKLVRIYPSIPFDNFFIPYTTTVCLNWPYDDGDVLMTLPDTEELALNPLFERHLMDLGNWTLGPAFAKAHPDLVDTFKVGHGDGRRTGS